MTKLAACLACVVLAVATAANTKSLRMINPDGFVRKLTFKHRLRVCNAYPSSAPLDVIRGKDERLTGNSPMLYKSCRDFVTPLTSGDKLEFKVGDSSAGTFSVSDLPDNDAILLLVIHRHDTASSAVAFESHVFATLFNAQVALIDTYKGKAKGEPRIMDESEEDKKPRSEDLRFNSVVAVNPGTYRVVLDGDGGVKDKDELVASSHESYVILRTGVEARQGPWFPQELVVYPKSDKNLAKSSAFAVTPTLFMFLLVVSSAGSC